MRFGELTWPRCVVHHGGQTAGGRGGARLRMSRDPAAGFGHPALAPEDRIGAWVGHDREFRQAVALVRACLGKWGYKLESPTANQAQNKKRRPVRKR